MSQRVSATAIHYIWGIPASFPCPPLITLPPSNTSVLWTFCRCHRLHPLANTHLPVSPTKSSSLDGRPNLIAKSVDLQMLCQPSNICHYPPPPPPPTPWHSPGNTVRRGPSRYLLLHCFPHSYWCLVSDKYAPGLVLKGLCVVLSSGEMCACVHVCVCVWGWVCMCRGGGGAASHRPSPHPNYDEFIFRIVIFYCL